LGQTLVISTAADRLQGDDARDRDTAAQKTSLWRNAFRCGATRYFTRIVSGTAGDHILISCVAREGEILNSLRRNLPNVIAVHVPTITCGALMAIVQTKKTAEGQPQQAIMAAFGTETYCKCVVVVG